MQNEIEKTKKPKQYFLKDYKTPDWEVRDLNVKFQIFKDYCLVTSQFTIKKLNSQANSAALNGEDLKLKKVSLNSKFLPEINYSFNEDHELVISNLKDKTYLLEIVTEIDPFNNTSLEGLYSSGSILCTQCEAQGFRKITYFFDRPDVMTNYTVTIEADKTQYPILLSNGDCTLRKDLSDGRHQVVWKDPFKKPCYLFALVAGDLGVIKDTFTTMSGKIVQLEIYSPHGTQHFCQFAMKSLKSAMAWDEKRFRREYDLSTYMILATDDFNAGAMENKGLNVFNSRLVYADQETATDYDYFSIDSVIAHEYFHNWTGNRVTLRDWFHLSLKEGLTVFRDQEYSMDHYDRSIVRIESVNDLRNSQFAEDAGPNAHPIRPESCFAVDNFFTSTIYEKGAEVIRMMQTMVGRPAFSKGMDLYFERHDGQAVIIEDFAKSISDANNQDWTQFKQWYGVAGTPNVTIEEKFDPKTKTYEVSLSQNKNPPFHIPLSIGLFSKETKSDLLTEANLKIQQAPISVNSENQKILHLKEAKIQLKFANIESKPILSLNRGFSAPINLDWTLSDSEILDVIKSDSDDFNRWDFTQKLFTNKFNAIVDKLENSNFKAADSDSFSTELSALKDFSQSTLSDSQMTAYAKSLMLEIPTDSYFLLQRNRFQSRSYDLARQIIKKALCNANQDGLLLIYQSLQKEIPNEFSSHNMGSRNLKNSCLYYLAVTAHGQKLLEQQFETAKNMTDYLFAAAVMLNYPGLRQKSIEQFYQRFESNSLVLNKWFGMQALSNHPETFDRVVKLSEHKDFNIKNPNRVYSLLSRFGDNLTRFHSPDQDCYTFMADKLIEIDKLNPQVAARVAGCFDIWKKIDINQSAKVQKQLERLERSGLSSNTYEIISKQLK